VNRVRIDVFGQRIGSKLATAVGKCPALDFGHQSTRHAVATKVRIDVQPLEKRDRRTIRAIDVVGSLRRFYEAQRSAVFR